MTRHARLLHIIAYQYTTRTTASAASGDPRCDNRVTDVTAKLRARFNLKLKLIVVRVFNASPVAFDSFTRAAYFTRRITSRCRAHFHLPAEAQRGGHSRPTDTAVPDPLSPATGTAGILL